MGMYGMAPQDLQPQILPAPAQPHVQFHPPQYIPHEHQPAPQQLRPSTGPMLMPLPHLGITPVPGHNSLGPSRSSGQHHVHNAAVILRESKGKSKIEDERAPSTSERIQSGHVQKENCHLDNANAAPEAVAQGIQKETDIVEKKDESREKITDASTSSQHDEKNETTEESPVSELRLSSITHVTAPRVEKVSVLSSYATEPIVYLSDEEVRSPFFIPLLIHGHCNLILSLFHYCRKRVITTQKVNRRANPRANPRAVVQQHRIANSTKEETTIPLQSRFSLELRRARTKRVSKRNKLKKGARLHQR